MAKAKKMLSAVLAALMVVLSVASYVPAQAAKAVNVPKLQMVTQPEKEYKNGDRVSFTVTSPNYGGQVEYRVILWNGTTKTQSELWPTHKGYYYQNWKPAGSYKFTIHWPVDGMQPGAYSLTVLTRRANSKVAYDSFVKTEAFWVKNDLTVESIAPVADVTVNEGEKVTLPENVTLNMSDKTTKEAKVTWAAVDTAKPGEYTVEGTVEGTDKKATVKVVVKEVAFGVESVSANNLKTVVVKFTKPVDEDTLSKITITNNKIADCGLLEDGKTAIVVLETAVAQSKTLEVKVNGVAVAEGTATVKDFVQKISAVDNVMPELLSATALNAKQIELKFSEPVDKMDNKTIYRTYSNVKIDGLSVIATSTVDYINNTVVLTLPTVKAPGSYKLEVSGVYDFAGFKIASKSFDIAIVEDKNAPKIVDAKVIDINTIVVTFDEAIDVLYPGSIKVNGTTATPAKVDKPFTKQLKLTLGKSLDLGAVVEIKVQYKGQKDVVGNKVDPEETYSFNIKDDTTLPTVSLEVKAGNKVVLTFSKPMLVAGEITLLNKDGKKTTKFDITSALFKKDTNNTVIEIPSSKLGLSTVDPADYTLVISGMKDATIRANQLPEQKIAFKSVDTKLPVVTETYFLQQDTDDHDYDTVTFYFNEAMDEDSIKNLSNYVVGNTSFAAIDGVEVAEIAADKKSITFYYPKAFTDLKDTVRVYALKDVAGNMILNGFVDVKKLLGTELTIDNLENDGVKAVSTNTIKIKFNTPIASIDPSAFVIKKGADIFTTFVAATLNSTGKIATLTVNPYKEIGADAYNYTVALNDNEAVENIYGECLAKTTVMPTMVDVIAPSIDDVAQNENKDGVAIENQIIVTFTEPINLDKSELKLRDEDGVVIPSTSYSIDITADKTQAIITLDWAEEDTITVQFGMPVPVNTADTKGNTLVAYDFENLTLTVLKKTTSNDAATEAKAQAAAEVAVKAYEVAPITTTAEITAAEALKPTDAVINAVTDATKKAEFVARIKVVDDKIVAQKAVLAAQAEAAALAKAEAAVKAYEAAPITTAAEITTAEALRPTDAVINAVTDAAKKADFVARIKVVDDKITAQKAVLAAQAEAAAQAAAEIAVKAYEDAPLTTAEEITAAKALRPADAIINAVTEAAKKADFIKRIQLVDAKILVAESK